MGELFFKEFPEQTKYTKSNPLFGRFYLGRKNAVPVFLVVFNEDDFNIVVQGRGWIQHVV